MQNITVEKLKADAARLGFHRKPLDELVKLVTASVSDQFHGHLNRLNARKERLSKKLESLRKNLSIIDTKVGESRIDSGAMMMAISGPFIIISIFYMGKIHSTIFGVIYVALSIIGAVYVRISPTVSDFWRPIMYLFLSAIIGGMQTQSSYDSGYSLLISIFFGLAISAMAFILNYKLFNVTQCLKSQVTAIWFRLRKFINETIGIRTSQSMISVEKRLAEVIAKKETMLEKSISAVRYEYDLAELASSIKKTKKTTKHYQLNGKAVNYAN